MRLERNGPYWLLLGGSSLWLATAFASPWWASQPPGTPGPGAAKWLYFLYGPVCHQISERSFQCFGHPVAACHRCIGLYAGFVVGLLIMPSLPRWTAWLADYPRRMAYFALPMLADYFLWQNVWWSRTLSGWVAALPVGLFVWAALTQLASHRSAQAALATSQSPRHCSPGDPSPEPERTS